MVKIKGAQNPIIWVIVALVLFAMVSGTGIQGLIDKLTGKAVISPEEIASTRVCGDDGLADVRLRYRNGANTSTTPDWSAATLYLVDESDKSIKTSYTLTSAGEFAATANTLSCGKTYSVVTLNDASYTATKSQIKTVDEPIEEFDVVGSESSELEFNLYSLAYVNETNTANSFSTGSQDFTSVTNNAMDQSSNLGLRFEVEAVTTGQQFGSSERLCETETGVCGRAFVCITGASSVYSETDLSIAGEVIVGKTSKLPSRCAVLTPSNAGVGRAAFETTAIQGGWKSGTVSITASLGTPGDTNNVNIQWMDNNYYRGVDGKLKIGTADQGGTSTGETDRYFEVNIT